MSSLALAPLGSTSLRWQEDGASDDAARIRSSIARAVEHILTATSTGAAYLASNVDLAELQVEASEENWDSKGARPLDPLSVMAARRFLALIPTTFPAPYISADPDGEVAFEWEGRRGALFSVSFSPGENLTYAGLFGSGRVRGTEYFGDEIPAAIIDGLRRTVAGR